MVEYNWEGDIRSRGGPESLLRRLDAASALVDDERYWEARGALHGKRWTEDLDLTTVPADVLGKAQQFVAAACDELTGRDVNANLVRNYLFQARRALTG
jgi:hypothetical protein